MANGKITCKILKELRRRIAEANDINLIIEKCNYKGDCTGTCPRCEAEVRYLEDQLLQRRIAGKAVAIAGISAGMMILSCCSPSAKITSESPIPDAVDVTSLDTAWSDITIENPLPDTLSTINNSRADCDNTAKSEGNDNLYLTGETISEIIYIETDSIPPVDPDKIFDVVEKKPRFPGGDNNLMKYISCNISFPDSIDKNNLGCRVVVKFAVMKDGSIDKVTVVRSKGEFFDNEAVRIVKSLPAFIPGEMNGNPVNVWYTLPVTFKRN